MKKYPAKGGHGGARPGAGRKKSDTETKVISFRVPAELEEELRDFLKSVLSKYLKQKRT